MRNRNRFQLATRAVRAGVAGPRPDFTPTVVPIHPSTTYGYDSMDTLDAVFAGTREGYVYGRYANPTVTALEDAVAALESGDAGVAFGSGMAAIHGALLAAGARSGSTVLAAQDIYGGTYALLDQVLRSQGVRIEFVDATDLAKVDDACSRLKPTIVLVETVSNPLLRLVDVQALADISHRSGAILMVDNTFATPWLVQPLALGADVVIHSATKYLGGHGDALGGVAVVPATLEKETHAVRKVTGANLAPQEAWLLLRGIRTLPLRMRQHCENALLVARWLENQHQISRVIYPGLPSHPQHQLAPELFGERGYGGIVSFELPGAGQDEVFRFFEALELCLPVTTLGDVVTLVMYPAHSSHRAIAPEDRARIGIGEGLVRLSVGLEAVEDLLADLGQALQVIG